MAELDTSYLGLSLKSPILLASSSLSTRVANLQAAERAGAGAVVLRSLFEEQIEAAETVLQEAISQNANSSPEASSYFPAGEIGPREYLQTIARSKKAVQIPVIASLNCVAPGSWSGYAKQIEESGADALEVNLYAVQAEPTLDAAAVEKRYEDIVGSVLDVVHIPVAVKLSPYFTALANFVARLDRRGAKGFVLFNRFLQPDISIDQMALDQSMVPSHPAEALVPLRWIALLYGRIQGDLAASTGVHDTAGLVKQLVAGATVVQLASVLLKNGPAHVGVLRSGLEDWMDKRGYTSLSQLRGKLSQKALKDPCAFERAQYVQLLQSQS